MKTIINKLSGISFQWDADFIKNIMIVVGVVAIWRTLWSFLPNLNPLVSSVLAMTIGMILLYLPDGTLQEFGEFIKEKK